MDYILNDYHRNISDDDLLNDLKSVAKGCGKDTLTGEQYNKRGRYNSCTIARRFGSWNKAIALVGLKRANGKLKHHELCTDSQSFLEDVRRVAQCLQQNFVTVGDYRKYGKYGDKTAFRKYGNWNEMLKEAGLSSTPFRLGKGKKITNEELFEDIERVWTKLGRQPTITDVKNGLFNYGQNTFVRRFGGWRNALLAFVDYINEEETPIRNELKNKSVIHNKEQNTDRISSSTNEPYVHKTNREPNLRLRFKVLARDHFKCYYCGKSPATDPSVVLHVDHIKPWAKGGETTMDNLRTSCSKCNLGKSDMEDRIKNNL